MAAPRWLGSTPGPLRPAPIDECTIAARAFQLALADHETPPEELWERAERELRDEQATLEQ